MSAAVNNRPNLWYAHSPLNEIWAFHRYIRESLLSAWKVSPYEVWVRLNRRLTRRYAEYVGGWVCNSENTRGRIMRYYGRDAEVIYPPVDTAAYGDSGPGGFWLSVNRLAAHKRIEFQLEAFRKMPELKLVIVGSYEKGVEQFENYKKFIEKIMPENAELLHWAGDAELKDLYSRCRGFITTAKDEDFGMTAVEAMASGKPVVAPAEGGYKETVSPETGRLIEGVTPDKIMLAVREVEAVLAADPFHYSWNSMRRAAAYDTGKFIGKIRAAMDRTLRVAKK